MINFKFKTTANKIKFFALIFLGLNLACTQDENETSQAPSKLIFDTSLETELAGAFLQVYGTDRSNRSFYSGCSYRMVLYSKGINVIYNDFGKVVGTSGQGYVIEVNFYAENKPVPESGNYFLQIPSDGPRPVGSIGSSYIHYYEDEPSPGLAFFDHGQVQISNNGTSWTIEGRDLISTVGESASFFYDGALVIYDQRPN